MTICSGWLTRHCTQQLRAALMTSRLLAFSRQRAEPKTVSVNSLITGCQILRLILGESIRMETVLAAGCGSSFIVAATPSAALMASTVKPFLYAFPLDCFRLVDPSD